ncbi:nucleotide exchange factor GrpE [Buchnera aphidicola (Hormaphis cornu)]|nr:nucleotide exchange factor GrpE [Buchnera aphidicola (Hormaphis cornu)]
MNEIKLRSQANIENIRKQTTKKIEEIKKKSFIDFNSRLILIIDQLESIIKTLQIFNNKDNTIIQGLLLTMQSFLKATKKIGLIKEKATETYFNPTIHEITAITEPKKNLKNHIVTISKPGYKLNNIILRKSIVKISNKNKENNIT